MQRCELFVGYTNVRRFFCAFVRKSRHSSLLKGCSPGAETEMALSFRMMVISVIRIVRACDLGYLKRRSEKCGILIGVAYWFVPIFFVFLCRLENTDER